MFKWVGAIASDVLFTLACVFAVCVEAVFVIGLILAIIYP